jgi:hypothetical protein
LKDASHPFFRPLWRRVALVAVCAAWTVVELVVGDPTWAVMTGAIGAYAAWTFLIAYKPATETAEAPRDPPAG